LRIVLWLGLLLPVAGVYAQQGSLKPVPSLLPESPESVSLASQSPQQEAQPAPAGTSGEKSNPKPSPAKSPEQATPSSQQQPKRILGVMPNYRAVSAGTIPPRRGLFLA
jgi:hypothetical protein